MPPSVKLAGCHVESVAVATGSSQKLSGTHSYMLSKMSSVEWCASGVGHFAICVMCKPRQSEVPPKREKLSHGGPEDMMWELM